MNRTSPAPAVNRLERLRQGVAVSVMLSGAVLMALIFTVLSPVLPEIAEHFAGRGGAVISQLIMSVPGLGVIIGGLTGGVLVDRLGRRPMLYAALILYAIAGSTLLYLDHPWALLAGRLVVGWSAATAQTALIGMIGATFRDPQRARVIGYASAVGSAGAIVSVLASGAIAQAADWRAPAALYLFSLPVLALAVLVLRRSNEVAPATDAAAEAPSRGVLRRLAPFFAMIPFLYAANYMLAIQMSFLLAANGVEGPAAKSRILVIGVAMGVVGAASSGWVRHRLGEARTLALLSLLLGVGYGFVGLAHTAPLTILGAAIAGIGSGMVLPTLMTMAVARTPDSMRSRAIGFVYSAAYVGEFMNPVVFSPIVGAVGIHGLFLIVGGLLTAVGLAVAFLTRRRGGASLQTQEEQST